MRAALGRLAAAAALLLGVSPTAARAQVGEVTGCELTLQQAQCWALEQALHAALPQVGIALVGGNPLPGTAGVAGIRLGLFPGATGSLRVNAAGMHTPDVSAADRDIAAHTRAQTLLLVGGDAVAVLTPGVTRGTLSGIGSLDLLLGVGILPAGGELQRTVGVYGAGVRLGLLRESFTTPGVSLSAQWRGSGRVRYGSCEGSTRCDSGHRGALAFTPHLLSTRLVVGKRVARVGLSGGVGYDRVADGKAEWIFNDTGFAGEDSRVVHPADVAERRWSGFGGLSWALPVGAVTMEGGWMGGGRAIAGYPAGADYRPGRGTAFGSLALRLSL